MSNMADEDEIDILGDFSLDNLLSKNENEINKAGGVLVTLSYDNSGLVSHSSDVLNCDCASQWLLDHTTTSNSTCWYNNGHSDFCTDLVQEHTQNDQNTNNCCENQISTENAISDESGWTKKEKNLLERGIEIFGKSNVRLAQFIGTKTATEVKHYLKHFYSSTQSSVNVSEEAILDGAVIEETVIVSDNIEHASDGNEVLDDSEIPASIEEIIAAVSTAKPTVQVNPKKPRKNSSSKLVELEVNYRDIPSGHSILKSNVYKHIENSIDVDDKTVYKRREVRNRERSISPTKKTKRKNVGEFKFKFRTKLKVSKGEKIKTKRRVVENKVLSPATYLGSAITATETRPIIPNINGEEVVKMKKENSEQESDSDLEIDVENINEDMELNNKNKTNVDFQTGSEGLEQHNSNIANKDLLQLNSFETTKCKELSDTDIPKKVNKDLAELSEQVSMQLMSMEFPTSELHLAQNTVTDLEKCINSEFFEGRPTKTSGRYLKIRNHIINTWLSSKPSYVTKTSIRPGLKNCGDVNSIGRIHHFLEQIGAINFGCAQTTYIRPLQDMLLTSTPPPKEKVSKDLNVVASRPIMLSRPRIKKKFTNDGEGGCTLAHNEKGDVINTTVVNEEPVVKQRPYIKRPTIKLIYCKPFTDEHPQKYSIHLHLSTLLLLDLHAHISHTEVMGLIGGYWNPDNKTLTISRYVPCRNIAPSATHCDMCPISQAKAADIIHGEGLNILGWFHSHPTFAPEPSQQDLDTQLSVQQWIGTNKPCIGLILSPFNAHGALIASPYRCLIVDKRHNFEDQYVPYKFKVELLSSNLDLNHLLSEAWRIFNSECNVSAGDRVDFNKAYFLDQSISYLDKFMSSVKMHLAKCSDVNKLTCDAITEGLSRICCSQS